VFNITAGPPLHDPVAVAAILTGTEHEIPFYDWDFKTADGTTLKERFEVTIVTDGTYEDAKAGAQTGRTRAKMLEPGADGVRIPRGVDIPAFWRVIEECIERADVVNAAAKAALKVPNGSS
jgi:uridine nucleosidase